MRDYEVIRERKPAGKEKVNLFIVSHRVKRDKVTCFVTNMDVDEVKALVYGEEFRKRWGIKMSYRVKGDFRPKTTSKNFAVRLFYFYLLW